MSLWEEHFGLTNCATSINLTELKQVVKNRAVLSHIICMTTIQAQNRETHTLNNPFVRKQLQQTK